uniref:CCHC-type domain-containing protein n=1 Tax=Gouania willdenowi TaxID=441366 RepID=A0A8C5DCT6_GOUWI
MDLCNRFGVDGQSSLYITGIDGDYTDEEIASTFEVNGEVSKIVKVPDEPGQPEGRVLLQYTSNRSISKIDPIILGTIPSPKDPAVVWSVRTIGDVCQEEIGKEIARKCLDELGLVAGSSMAGFLSILQSEIKKAPDTTQVHVSQTSNTSHHDITSDDNNKSPEPSPNRGANASMSASPVHVDENIFNPPHIQKVIVEHVIRNESTTPSSTHLRMRTFSGRMPRPNGEVDYDVWRTQVDLLLADPSLNDTHKVRKILESLLSPAADVIKSLGITSPPNAYVTQLDSAFGVVEDGEELFSAFLSANQNNGEKPSAYLNRLHSLLSRAISRGGAFSDNSNDQLLRQFCRGCWDQSIIIGLQLEYKKSNPPSFPEFLLMLRTEEDRRSAKLDRMKKHLGTSKAAAHAHHIFNVPSYDYESIPTPNTKRDEPSKLEKRVSELTKQVEKLHQKSQNPISDTSKQLVSKQRQSESSKLETKLAELTKQVENLAQIQKENQGALKKDCLAINSSNTTKHFRVPGMPRPWFCFKCGQDGHIAAQCSNEPNPTLVRNKNAELRERQGKFLAQQAASPFALN